MKRELQCGETLDGRFQVTRLINHGGLASVFEAVDQASGKPVALKVPFPECESDPVYSSRFRREEFIGLSLDHPSIVRILPVGEKCRSYIVMERLEGTLLSELLASGRPMPVSQALRIAGDIARALEYLHGRGALHRDLKPGNIMLCTDGSLRVIDLGLATSAQHEEVPAPLLSPAVGTPDYMPPEQVLGRKGDARSDLYALGAILYEMTTGCVPFEGEDVVDVMNARVAGDPPAPTRLNRDLPPQVEEIILHALERDPERRYASASDFLKDLDAPDRVAPSDRASRLSAPKRWMLIWLKTRDFAWTFLAMMAFFAVAILFAWMFGRRR